MLSCFFCECFFSTLKTLMLHISLKHKTFVYSQVQCNFTSCFKKFGNVYSLKRHLIRDHRVENEIPHSVLCNSSFHIRDKIISDNNTSVYNTDDTRSRHVTVTNERFELQDISNNSIVSCYIENHLNNCEDITLNTFQNMIIDLSLRFLVYLYAYGSLSRKAVHKIINEMSNSYLLIICTIMSNKFSNNDDLCAMLNIIKKGFKIFRTEHLTFSYLKKIEYLFMPSKITIRSYLTAGRYKKKVKTVLHNSTISVIPLKLVIKKFLELPNVYSSILSHIKKCRNSNFCTFFNSEYWKTVESEIKDKTVLPLVLYFDDVEINNPLGSHKGIHKIGVVYSSILGLPHEFLSALKNIFLVQINNYQDHKVVGNKRIFQHVINIIIDLQENGITISIDGKQQKIFFVLAFIVGDNLDLNTILGFPRSFKSHYCCRICYENMSNFKKQSAENINKIRTKENYMLHLRDKSYGIEE